MINEIDTGIARWWSAGVAARLTGGGSRTPAFIFPTCDDVRDGVTSRRARAAADLHPPLSYSLNMPLGEAPMGHLNLSSTFSRREVA